MNRDAIFSDGTPEFVRPWEAEKGDKVMIRARAAHADSARMFILSGSSCTEMRLETEEKVFDYFRASIFLGENVFSYIFKVVSGNETVYLDRYGVSDDIRWQYAFKIVPGFHTPEWIKGAVMYQILVDRFANGDESNDTKTNEYHYCGTYARHIDNWNQVPDVNLDVANFYGGDLEGVRQKIYYLKGLGVDVIYFNPLFVSPSNHKYDIQDYEHIDPHFAKIVNEGGDVLKDGDTDNKHATCYKKRVTDRENLEASNKFFADFIEEAHARGMRVIMDGVFNHCGSFNKWMDRERIYEGEPGYSDGAYISEKSPYHSYFQFNKDGKWPYNNAYDGWWGHDTLPKLNYEGSWELTEKIIDIGRMWVSPPYNADGWRLDVAADLGHSEDFNHKFWRRFREAVKEANPDAVILAEHYGDASSWLMGDQWDTIMNYDAFMEPVTFFLTGMEKHSDEFHPEALGDGNRFEMTMRHTMTEFLIPSLYSAMNQLSNHDHSRFLTRTNHKAGRVSTLGPAAAGEGINKAVLKEGTLMLMTWPGAPTVYYGDEAGVVGFTDPDNRRTYPWGHADYELIDFHRDMISVHKMSPALKTGAFEFIKCGRDLVSYGRFTPDQKMVIAVNSGDYDLSADLPVWKAEVPMECQMVQVIMTNDKGYSIMPTKYDVHDGNLNITLKPHEAVVLRKNI